MATKRRDVQTREEMWALIQRNDSVAVTALMQLVTRHQEAANHGVAWIVSSEDRKFLISLCSQAKQKRERGQVPVLSERQMVCLRKALEPYQEDLWQITLERLGLPDDRPYEREDEYEPGAEEPINPAWQEFCACGQFAQVQHVGGFYCLPCRRALDEPAYDLRILNEMVDPR